METEHQLIFLHVLWKVIHFILGTLHDAFNIQIAGQQERKTDRPTKNTQFKLFPKNL